MDSIEHLRHRFFNHDARGGRHPCASGSQHGADIAGVIGGSKLFHLVHCTGERVILVIGECVARVLPLFSSAPDSHRIASHF